MLQSRKNNSIDTLIIECFEVFENASQHKSDFKSANEKLTYIISQLELFPSREKDKLLAVLYTMRAEARRYIASEDHSEYKDGTASSLWPDAKRDYFAAFKLAPKVEAIKFNGHCLPPIDLFQELLVFYNSYAEHETAHKRPNNAAAIYREVMLFNEIILLQREITSKEELFIALSEINRFSDDEACKWIVSQIEETSQNKVNDYLQKLKLADQAVCQNKLEDALTLAYEALRIFPIDPAVYSFIGLIYDIQKLPEQNSKMMQDFATLFKKAASLTMFKGEDLKAHKQIMYSITYQKICWIFFEGRVKEAMFACDQLRKDYPLKLCAKLLLGICYAGQMDSIEPSLVMLNEVERYLNKYKKTNENEYKSQSTECVLLIQRLNDAVARSVEQNKTLTILKTAINEALLNGDGENAIHYARQAYRIKPTDPDILIALGSAYDLADQSSIFSHMCYEDLCILMHRLNSRINPNYLSVYTFEYAAVKSSLELRIRFFDENAKTTVKLFEKDKFIQKLPTCRMIYAIASLQIDESTRAIEILKEIKSSIPSIDIMKDIYLGLSYVIDDKLDEGIKILLRGFSKNLGLDEGTVACVSALHETYKKLLLKPTQVERLKKILKNRYKEEKCHEELINCHLAILASINESHVYFKRAEYYKKNKQLQSAIQDLTIAIQIALSNQDTKNVIDGLRMRRNLLIENGNIERAKKDHEIILSEIDPSRKDSENRFFNLLQEKIIQEKSKPQPLSSSSSKTTLISDPVSKEIKSENPSKQQFEALKQKAKEAFNLNQIEEARRSFLSAIEIAKSIPNYHSEVQYVKKQLNLIDKKLEETQIALRKKEEQEKQEKLQQEAEKRISEEKAKKQAKKEAEKEAKKIEKARLKTEAQKEKAHQVIAHITLPKEAINVITALKTAGALESFVVGGMIRDSFLESKVSSTHVDIDIVTNASEDQIKKLKDIFPQIIIQQNEHLKGFFKIKTDDCQIDIYISDYLRDTEKNVYERLQNDASERDFTYNTFYANEKGDVFSPLGNSIDELKLKRLETVKEASESFKQDPIRILRAIYFSNKLNFELSNAIETAIKNRAPLLTSFPPSRVNAWLLKLFTSAHVKKNVDSLIDLGLIDLLFPTLKDIIRSKRETMTNAFVKLTKCSKGLETFYDEMLNDCTKASDHINGNPLLKACFNKPQKNTLAFWNSASNLSVLPASSLTPMR